MIPTFKEEITETEYRASYTIKVSDGAQFNDTISITGPSKAWDELPYSKERLLAESLQRCLARVILYLERGTIDSRELMPEIRL